MVMELKILPIEEIHPNPFQPRESFERESLKELGDSMKDASVVQPIVVRRHGKGYQIIAGERRWRAAQMTGLKEIPCIVKDVSEERVLLESLIENLHRRDLTDTERENAIHELWESDLFKTKNELAEAIGVRAQKIKEDIEAWEFRQRIRPNSDVPTWVIARTSGLATEDRDRIIEKVEKGEFRTTEVLDIPKIVRRASKKVKEELFKPKSFVTPKIAEIIVENLDTEEEQEVILEEVKRFRLTEDEVETRVREIKRAKEMGKPLTKEMGVKEGVVYTVGEYECPNCKRHYLIKCNGKKDWVE
ncbi:ParB/RepB/Spo0J family partition protein [Candidatus Bathyarchaeota archaeon]|nr:ParB/RepB/Spo0J family partition protein [Candidatus Bathyarchaeota archaeon]